MSDTLKWYGREVTETMKAGAVEGLKLSSESLLRITTPEVPVSPWSRGGFLRDTGKAEADEGELMAAVSYSGSSDNPSLPVYVHERTDVQHETGSAKFLESALMANKDELLRQIADAIKAKTS